MISTWWLHRLLAVGLIPIFLFWQPLIEIPFLPLIFSLILIYHIYIGVIEIFEDYIHSEGTFKVAKFCLRILSIFLLKSLSFCIL